jgi:hypothetical protein
VDEGRPRLLADIDSWLAASGALAAALADNRELVEKGQAMIAEGTCLSEAIAAMSTTTRYLRMNQALAEFELARFALRSSLLRAALDEGLTHRELVELLGVPPELTAQVLDEMERGRPD